MNLAAEGGAAPGQREQGDQYGRGEVCNLGMADQLKKLCILFLVPSMPFSPTPAEVRLLQMFLLSWSAR
jgi:hypothetical protein